MLWLLCEPWQAVGSSMPFSRLCMAGIDIQNSMQTSRAPSTNVRALNDGPVYGHFGRDARLERLLRTAIPVSWWRQQHMFFASERPATRANRPSQSPGSNAVVYKSHDIRSTSLPLITIRLTHPSYSTISILSQLLHLFFCF